MSNAEPPAIVSFRRATDQDINSIALFNSQLAEETEGKLLDPETIQSGVATGLRHFPEVQYFVAESADSVVGQLMFTREWSDWRNGWMLWLQSVYVQLDFRKQGVFRELLDFALQTVSVDQPSVGVRLYAERDNHAAIAIYEHLGFQDAGYRILEMVPLAVGKRQ